MSRLPKDMIRKGSCYYLRLRQMKGGVRHETTVPLGNQFDLARTRYDRERRIREEWRDQPTVAEFSERWLKDYVGPMRTGKGPALAKQRMRDFVLPLIGKQLIPEVSEADLMALRAHLDRSGKAVLTVRHILSDVRCLFRFAVAARLIDRTPFAGRVLPRIQEEIPEPLSDIELGRVLQECPKRHGPLIGLALWTGLRYSELRGLRWDCVFPDDAEPHALIVRSGHAEWTKSHRARRVPLLEEAVGFLRAAPRSSEFVFTGRFRGMIEPGTSGASRAIAVKVPGFHFHRLRHTFASRFVRAGGNLRVLQRILGHASIKTTERYVRLFDADVSREMRALPANWLHHKVGEDWGKIGGSS
jgi:integrase